MRNLVILTAIILILGVVYLFAVEGVHNFTFMGIGGQDAKFSFYDMLLIAFPLISVGMLSISAMAYRRKPDMKLLLISFAFLMFTAEGLLKIIVNFFSGDFRIILVAIQLSEMLILISFLYAIIKK